jgi:hypothetical protein
MMAPIDLLFTDIVLPAGMNRRQLGTKCRRHDQVSLLFQPTPFSWPTRFGRSAPFQAPFAGRLGTQNSPRDRALTSVVDTARHALSMLVQAAERPDQQQDRDWDSKQPEQSVSTHYFSPLFSFLPDCPSMEEESTPGDKVPSCKVGSSDRRWNSVECLIVRSKNPE